MSDAAKIKNIEFVQTMDGANLSKHESHTLMGYCIVDEEAQDPITKQILFCGNDRFAATKKRLIHNSVKQWADRAVIGVKSVIGWFRTGEEKNREIIERTEN